MREIPISIRDALERFEDFTYCFHIKLVDGRELHLTTADNFILINNVWFAPHSGLTLQEAEFNDSAQNYIVLQGIFEHGGIDFEMDLTSASVQILLALKNDYYHLVTYYCSSYVKQDLGFKIYLVPETVKYNQTLTQVFSKTCRANFGDAKCQVNKQAYTYTYNVKELHDHAVTILNPDKQDGYFDQGEMVLGGRFYARIIKNCGELIQVDKFIPSTLRRRGRVSLSVGCDKNFISCCNKFNNALNFRGESLIPDDNFIRSSSRNLG